MHTNTKEAGKTKPVVPELFNRHKFPNGNVLIVGTAGQGRGFYVKPGDSIRDVRKRNIAENE